MSLKSGKRHQRTCVEKVLPQVRRFRWQAGGGSGRRAGARVATSVRPGQGPPHGAWMPHPAEWRQHHSRLCTDARAWCLEWTSLQALIHFARGKRGRLGGPGPSGLFPGHLTGSTSPHAASRREAQRRQLSKALNWHCSEPLRAHCRCEAPRLGPCCSWSSHVCGFSVQSHRPQRCSGSVR